MISFKNFGDKGVNLKKKKRTALSHLMIFRMNVTAVSVFENPGYIFTYKHYKKGTRTFQFNFD